MLTYLDEDVEDGSEAIGVATITVKEVIDIGQLTNRKWIPLFDSQHVQSAMILLECKML